MRKTEFLQELSEALAGEVTAGVIQENVRYYDNYISTEAAKGRTEDEIIEEIGGPRLIARTIIDSSGPAGSGNNAGYSGGYYSQGADPGDPRQTMNSHYIDLNKWYWKLLVLVIVLVVLFLVFTVVGGIFSLLFRFAGPLIIIWLIYSMFKGMRR